MIKFLIATFLIGLIGVSARQGYGPGEQEWGFIDVRPGAHMFYWLYYTTANVTKPEDRPLVIWLQGGPGDASSYGNFFEIGPLDLANNLTERKYSWVDHVNVLFIDNPVGAGYSYVDEEGLYAGNNTQIGNDLVAFTKQFYKKFPKFSQTPLYTFGESYGGKMVMAFAKALNQEIQENGLSVNYQGLGLVDSVITAVDNILSWAPFLFYSGLIDERGYEAVQASANATKAAFDRGDLTLTLVLRAATARIVASESGGVDVYNILRKIPSEAKHSLGGMKQSLETENDLLAELMNGEVKQTLGIPDNVIFNNQSGNVVLALFDELNLQIPDVVEDIVNNTDIQVHVITGTLDLVVPTPSTVNWVDQLKWEGSKKWKTAERRELVTEDYIEGFYKEVDNLHLYWVLRAGHMVPADNPQAALEILRRVTKFDQ